MSNMQWRRVSIPFQKRGVGTEQVKIRPQQDQNPTGKTPDPSAAYLVFRVHNWIPSLSFFLPIASLPVPFWALASSRQAWLKTSSISRHAEWSLTGKTYYFSTHCFYRGLRFNSQHPHGGSQSSITPNSSPRKSNAPFLLSMVTRHAHNIRGSKTHKIKLKKNVLHKISSPDVEYSSIVIVSCSEKSTCCTMEFFFSLYLKVWLEGDHLAITFSLLFPHSLSNSSHTL